MTDRDRLINELKKAKNRCLIHESGGCLACKYRGQADCTLENLADHLLANGVIAPPCKVGDTIYSFCDVFGVILPYVIQNFGVGFLGKDRPNYWYWEATSHATETDELLDEIDFDLDDIGESIFLTKEEAEAKMKELGK